MASTGTSESPAAAGNAKPGGTAIFVIGGKSDDPFWSKVKRGVEAAAEVVEAQGGTVTFLGPQNYDNLGPDAAKLIDSAVSQGAAAIIGPDWVPEAEDAAFKRVVQKGIPLIIYNAGGIEAANSLGALNYVGSDEYTAGKTGGEFFGKQGAKNVLCVNTVPGAANTEARCRGIADGVKATGGTSKQLPMPSSNFGNPTAVAQGIKAALLKDDTIDGVVTISTQDADSAASGILQASLTDKVKLGTFDLDESQLNRIKDGKQLFAIDQQPYMQGFLSVSMAQGYLKYGLELPQKPLLTGPAVISKDNIDSAIAGAKAGVR
ncbi:sugar ABC transporter substrate-binding protein [Kribbella sp. NBC_00482]|uniref:sugar ABC transporter substrate-binding protein n=1 Tax=Kribbella sp. NBC_00482 TaxID=2975968 RepID=UPI002E19D652